MSKLEIIDGLNPESLVDQLSFKLLENLMTVTETFENLYMMNEYTISNHDQLHIIHTAAIGFASNITGQIMNQMKVKKHKIIFIESTKLMFDTYMKDLIKHSKDNNHE